MGARLDHSIHFNLLCPQGAADLTNSVFHSAEEALNCMVIPHRDHWLLWCRLMMFAWRRQTSYLHMSWEDGVMDVFEAVVWPVVELLACNKPTDFPRQSSMNHQNILNFQMCTCYLESCRWWCSVTSTLHAAIWFIINMNTTVFTSHTADGWKEPQRLPWRCYWIDSPTARGSCPSPVGRRRQKVITEKCVCDALMAVVSVSPSAHNLPTKV